MKRKYIEINVITSCPECEYFREKNTAPGKVKYMCTYKNTMATPNLSKETVEFIGPMSTPGLYRKAEKELEEMFATCKKWEEVK